MQPLLKTLMVATATVALFFQSPSVQAQTTGPGDRALVNIGQDRNYNCARSDAGQCLPDMAPQVGLDANIPAMPSAGEGGMSTYDHEPVRPDQPTESDAPVVSENVSKRIRPNEPTKSNPSAKSNASSESGMSQILIVLMAYILAMLFVFSRIARYPRGRRHRR